MPEIVIPVAGGPGTVEPFFRQVRYEYARYQSATEISMSRCVLYEVEPGWIENDDGEWVRERAT